MPIKHPYKVKGEIVTEEQWNAAHTLPSEAELAAILDPRYLKLDDVNAIADAVWDETAADHIAGGSFGKILNDMYSWYGAGYITNME